MKGGGWRPSRYGDVSDVVIVGFVELPRGNNFVELPRGNNFMTFLLQLLRHGLPMLRSRLGRWPRLAFGTQGRRKRFTLKSN